MTQRWTDDGCTDGRRQGKTMLLSHSLTFGGSNVTILVGLGGDSVTDKRTDDKCTDGRTEK